jgi:replicative DNA helicase
MPTQTLTHQAETALIGALLFDRRLLDDVPGLSYLDFATPEHREIFRTIADLHIQRPDATGARLAELVADRLNLPGVDEPYLSSLALTCPEPHAAAVYGRMVLEAALDRDLADHAVRMAAEAGTERGVDPAKDHLAALAEAIQIQAANVESATAAISASAESSTDIGVEQDARAVAEELALADLIQHPQLIAEVENWLEPEMFTGGRGLVYESILAVDEFGAPIDEMTLAWELGRRQGRAETMYERAADDERPERVAPGTLARLVTTAVEIGVAVEIGSNMATDHFRAELAAEKSRVIAENGVHQTASTGASTAAVFGESRRHELTEWAAPRLLEPPPTPTVGPDGPQLRS